MNRRKEYNEEKAMPKEETRTQANEPEKHLLIDHEALSVLSKEAKLLRETLDRTQAPGRRFFIGVLAGVGYALGATVVAAILLFWLSQLLARAGLTNVVPGFGQEVQQHSLNLLK